MISSSLGSLPQQNNENHRLKGILNLINEASSRYEEYEAQLIENSDKENKNNKDQGKESALKKNTSIYMKAVEEYFSGQKEKLIKSYELHKGDLLQNLSEKLEYTINARTEKMKKLAEIGKFMLSDKDETKQLLMELKDCSSADIDFLLNLANTEPLWKDMHNAINEILKEKFDKINEGLFGSDSILKYSANKPTNKIKNQVNKKGTSNQLDNNNNNNNNNNENNTTEQISTRSKRAQSTNKVATYNSVPERVSSRDTRNKKGINTKKKDQDNEIGFQIKKEENVLSSNGRARTTNKKPPPVTNYQISKKAPRKAVYESESASRSEVEAESGSEIESEVHSASQPESEENSKDEEYTIEDDRKFTKKKKVKI